MTSHEIHALSGAYAVDALDDTERALFEEHLASCSECRTEVEELREATALLAETVAVAPPPQLRERVLSGIGSVRPLPPVIPTPAADSGSVSRPHFWQRRTWTAFAAAAAVMAAVITGATVVERARTDAPISAVDRVLQARDAQRIDVDLPHGASVSVIRSVTEGHAVLLTRGLPPAPNGKVYELWLQSADGVMQPAGLLASSGTRSLLFTGDASDAVGAGITVEPAGGSEAPTSAPIALFDFQRAT